jgi:hypothetical protein
LHGTSKVTLDLDLLIPAALPAPEVKDTTVDQEFDDRPGSIGYMVRKTNMAAMLSFPILRKLDQRIATIENLLTSAGAPQVVVAPSDPNEHFRVHEPAAPPAEEHWKLQPCDYRMKRYVFHRDYVPYRSRSSSCNSSVENYDSY